MLDSNAPPIVKSHGPPPKQVATVGRRRVDQMTYARRTAAKAATPATAMEPPKVLAEPVKAIGELVGEPVAFMPAPVPVGAATPEP